MDEKQNKSSGISKKSLYILGGVVVLLGLFLALNAYSFFAKPQPQQVSSTVYSSTPSTYASSTPSGVIPSQVGGCS